MTVSGLPSSARVSKTNRPGKHFPPASRLDDAIYRPSVLNETDRLGSPFLVRFSLRLFFGFRSASTSVRRARGPWWSKWRPTGTRLRSGRP